MRRLGSVASVALALTLAACGSDDTRSGDTDATASDRPTMVETATPPTPEPTPSLKILSKADLESALLGVQDMPPGYSQDPPSRDTNRTFCKYKPPFGDGRVYVRADFTKGGGMSSELLRFGLRQYASAAQAKASFDAITNALKTCHSETYEGSKLTYSPMSAPRLGDGAIGVKIDADGTTLVQNYVLVGPTLVATGGGGLINTDAGSVAELLTTQVNRYTAAASD